MTSPTPVGVASHPPLQGQGAHWTPLRQQILQFLKEKAPSLAELYFGAVTIMELRVPGRVRFVCHAAREICNRLPDVMSGIEAGPRLNYKGELDQLVEVWKSNGVLSELDASVEDTGDIPVTVPRQVYVRTTTLLLRHDRTREKPVEAPLRLFQSIAPENRQLGGALEPMIKQWVEVVKWFVGRAHDGGYQDSVHETELTTKFDLLEVALGALVGGFHSRLDDIDGILDQANS